MGREVKIVHMDFDLFERGKEKDTWEGYILDEIECPLCKGECKNLKGKECPVCYGEGKVSPEIEVPKSWDEKENGYQIWQDVSEGGPVSPIFKKPEDLAKWMVDNDNSITRDTTYQGWLKFIKEEGSSPSMIGGLGGLKSGVASLYNEEAETPTKKQD